MKRRGHHYHRGTGDPLTKAECVGIVFGVIAAIVYVIGLTTL